MDIVERLRDTTGIHEDLIYEAADMIELARICDAYNAKSVAWANVEITRLREALMQIVDFDLYGDYSNAYAISEIAREALKEKE